MQEIDWGLTAQIHDEWVIIPSITVSAWEEGGEDFKMFAFAFLAMRVGVFISSRDM